jgi:hypothetical protein
MEPEVKGNRKTQAPIRYQGKEGGDSHILKAAKRPEHHYLQAI